MKTEPINLKTGRVNCLNIDAPWKQEDLDTYWWAFVNFWRWSERKKSARLEAFDTNLKVSGYESRRLVIFYDDDRKELKLAAKQNGETAMRIVVGIKPEELFAIKSFEEIWDSAQTVKFKRPRG